MSRRTHHARQVGLDDAAGLAFWPRFCVLARKSLAASMNALNVAAGIFSGSPDLTFFSAELMYGSDQTFRQRCNCSMLSKSFSPTDCCDNQCRNSSSSNST